MYCRTARIIRLYCGVARKNGRLASHQYFNGLSFIVFLLQWAFCVSFRWIVNTWFAVERWSACVCLNADTATSSTATALKQSTNGLNARWASRTTTCMTASNASTTRMYPTIWARSATYPPPLVPNLQRLQPGRVLPSSCRPMRAPSAPCYRVWKPAELPLAAPRVSPLSSCRQVVIPTTWMQSLSCKLDRDFLINLLHHSQQSFQCSDWLE